MRSKSLSLVDPNTPVLVGVNLLNQREENPRQAADALQMMTASADQACRDTGVREITDSIDLVSVTLNDHQHPGLGSLAANTIGASNFQSHAYMIGVSQQRPMSAACNAIQCGEIRAALLLSAHTGYRSLRARIVGVELDEPVSTIQPDKVFQSKDSWQTDYERAAFDMDMPIGHYAVLDSALRHARAEQLDSHRQRLADQYSLYSRLAAQNPYAALRNEYEASFIRDHGNRNSMLAFPYTKRHSAQLSIDTAQALIFASASLAEAQGIAREKWIFPQVFTEANHMVNLTAREELHRCPGAAIASEALWQSSEKRAEDIDFTELYSCFPSALDIYTEELGWPRDRSPLFTGGYAMAGQAGNGCVLNTVVQLAHKLREPAGGTGLVATVSGVLTKQGFALFGSSPNPEGYRFLDVTPDVEGASRPRKVILNRQGQGRILGYTVLYRKKAPYRAVAVLETEDGHRSIAFNETPAVLAVMETTDFCDHWATQSQNQFAL